MKRAINSHPTREQAEKWVEKKGLTGKVEIREKRIVDRTSRKEWTYSIFLVVGSVEIYNEVHYG